MSLENQKYHYDLIVIGAGRSGLAAAFEAAEAGVDAAAKPGTRPRVAIIESHKLGGSGLWGAEAAGKILIRSAQVFDWVKRCEEFGIHVEKPRIVWSAIKLRIADVRDELRGSQKRQLAAASITVLGGRARLADTHTLEIETPQGAQLITASSVILATGRETTSLPIEGLATAGMARPEDLFARATLPRSIVFLGGGAEYAALAQALVRLGSQVTLLCSGDELLPDHEPEISRELARLLTNEGVHLRLGTQVVRGGVGAEGAEGRSWVEFLHGGEAHRVEAGTIVGVPVTTPRLEGLNLETAGVRFSSDGITVDCRGMTSCQHIYAVGSVASGPSVPTQFGTLTDPQAVRCGLTLDMALKTDPGARGLQTRMAALPAPAIQGENCGLIRLVTSADDRLLGVHILASAATDIIAPFASAITSGLTLQQCLSQIPAGSTLAGLKRTLKEN